MNVLNKSSSSRASSVKGTIRTSQIPRFFDSFQVPSDKNLFLVGYEGTKLIDFIRIFTLSYYEILYRK